MTIFNVKTFYKLLKLYYFTCIQTVYKNDFSQLKISLK